MADWTEPKYPGDTVRIQRFKLADEIGDVRVQDYGDHVKMEHRYCVATFLPGVQVFLPGDTPKTAPEKSEWCGDKQEAEFLFRAAANAAIADGWTVYRPP